MADVTSVLPDPKSAIYKGSIPKSQVQPYAQCLSA